TVTPGNAGTNQTYNLTALNAHTTDTLLFTLPQFTSHGSNFPGSNLAVEINTNQAYMYFNSQQTIFETTGQAADPFGSGIIDIPYSNPETQLTFPCNYNTAYTDIAKGEGWTYLGYDPGIGFQVDSVHIHTTVFKNSLVDGWGSATTPLGTYNVIRVNNLRHEIDSIDIQAFNSWIYDAYTLDDSTRSYVFWANGIGFPLAQLDDHQDLGSITHATWIPSLPQQSGISEFANVLDMSVYPNPSIETVTFSTKDAHVKIIRVLDASGQLIRTAKVDSNSTIMNVSDLATGMYFYQACDANGNILDKGKLNITH
ncbi:MAG TPA: T9SS type A sorting domain-containing protein, partial [Bacteroidia bacterium]|nr:T9SS type A sorting domain-containing protein [Bacteroidia bacterium]